MDLRSAVAGFLVLHASTVAAQTPLPPERPRDVAPAEAPRNKDDVPPTQVKLERLAELMGTLSFLRELCEPGGGAVWHDKMEELLASEGTSPMRRDRMAGAFNRGSAGYRLTYRSCTPAASMVIQRALDEGAQLSREISNRFSG